VVEVSCYFFVTALEYISFLYLNIGSCQYLQDLYQGCPNMWNAQQMVQHPGICFRWYGNYFI